MSEPLPFAVSPADAAVLDTLRTLLPAIAEGAAGYDERAEIPLASLHALRDAGIDRAVLPAALGGGGLGYQAFGEIVRLLSAADPATATVWVMHVGAGVGLAQLTSGTLGSYYADAFLAGDRFANALSEPTSGNRFLNPQQEAVPVEGGYVLSGAKRFVSGSEIAQHLLVNVAIGGVPTFFGLEPDESVSVIPIWDTLGLRATRSQLLHFSDTLLRSDRKGVFSPDQFNAVGSGLPAISLGIAQSALDAIIAQSNGRQIAGAPLSHQQWVQYEVADVAVKLEAATALYRDALRQADAGQPSSYSAFNKAKYLANKVAVEVAQLGVRVGGASGFLRTSPIQRHLRDAQAGQLMAYSTEVLAGVIGAEVLGVTESDTTPTEDKR